MAWMWPPEDKVPLSETQGSYILLIRDDPAWDIICTIRLWEHSPRNFAIKSIRLIFLFSRPLYPI